MNIVYCLAQCNDPSGGVRIIFEQANRLAARGHQVEIWTITPMGNKPPFPVFVPIRYLPQVHGNTGISPDIFVAGSCQVAHSYKSLPEAKHFWYFQHDEILTFPDDKEYDLTRKLYLDALRLPITFLCNSTWTKEVLKKKYNVNATLLRYGIDRKIFYPAKTPILSVDFPSLIFVCDHQFWKGIDDFYKAINIVLKYFPQLKVIAISQFRPAYIMFEPSIFFFRPSQDDLARIYSSVTLFVSSSWYEGFGLPGLEAMACGVPVVTTDSGGVREYAIPEETAVVVPPRNPQALADAIIRLLKDEPLRKKLIKNGLEKVKEFDWEKSIDLLENVFKNALK